MKIIVLNGSPKGQMSVTMQSVHFIRKKFPRHELKIFDISQRIKKIEKDETAFQEIAEEVRSSDGILWAFPVYVMLVPSQYKRFIELISEKGAKDAFKNKYAAVLTTSIHYFDHTAHNYMNAVCDDLNMKYAGSFSAEMHDLLKEQERKRLSLFAEDFFEAIENSVPTLKSHVPLIYRDFDYIPGDAENKVAPGSKKIAIVTDSGDSQTNLGRMIRRFSESFSEPAEVICLGEKNIKGGCLGCIHCGYDNECAYHDKFSEFCNTKLKTADILVFAGTIRDRYLSWEWKQFFDRSFFNNHVPSYAGKQMGFIISGPLGQIPGLREVLEAYTELQQANSAGFVTDESGDSAETDALLQGFAERLVRFSGKNYVRPRTFLGVGGMKIFRDEIWGKLRFVFQADHRFYKKHGMYDFPHKNFKTRITNAAMMLLTMIPAFRKEMYGKMMKQKMIEPHQKVLEKE